MNISLLKKLLPGILPLLIFILADEIWGTRIGLYVALGFGVGELLFYWIRDKKLDRFILLDTSLLLILGAISIALENDLTIVLDVIVFSRSRRYSKINSFFIFQFYIKIIHIINITIIFKFLCFV